MDENISFILSMFFQMLKEARLGFGVNDQGTFAFYNQETGEQRYILKENIEKIYDEL